MLAKSSKVHDASKDPVKKADGEGGRGPPESRASWTSFAAEVSILGVKYIVNKDVGAIRRIIWLCFVLTGFGFLIYHLHNRIAYYNQNPVNVNIELEYPDSLPFPSVTICNNNRFRKSSLAMNNELDLGYLYSIPSNQSVRGDISGYNWTWFHLAHGHDASTMLNAPNSCLWNGKPCSHTQFTQIITELGLCYTFNYGDTGLRSSVIGSAFGLTLILNVEQMEYLDTTVNAGFTVLLHDPANVPYIENLGFQVGPGESLKVGISRTEIKNLPPPYGKCADKKLAYYSPYSTVNCLTECRLNFTIKRCGCRETYMIPIDGVPECSPLQHWGCIVASLTNLAASVQDCACSVPCQEYHYGYTISHSKMSNIYAQSLSVQYPPNTKEHFMENYLVMSLYYTNLNYEVIQQQMAYEGLALFADIGGALGLVLGSTLMTGAEILDFLIALGLRAVCGK